MKIPAVGFNLILLGVLILLAPGCSAPGPKGNKSKDSVVLRFHLEVNQDGTDRNKMTKVGRSVTIDVNLEQQAFLTDFEITDAEVVDDSMGGFALRIQCNRRGTWILEQYTVANKGRRAAIFCQWDTNAYWIAAPVMEKRISDGAFSFTPDASRAEAERIVFGLNKQGKEIKKDGF